MPSLGLNPLGVFEQEMYDLIVEQHKAIDILMARLIALDKDFFPSKSVVWPTVLSGAKLIRKVNENGL